MPEPTDNRRRIGRGLLIGAALVLPLTATIGYAAPDAPDAPVPPAPPAAPDAPAAPAGPHKQHRIVIVEKDGGASVDESKLKTRVIERGGKTIVFKTDKDLTDAEIEEKIAKAEASIPKDIEVLVKSGHKPEELTGDMAGKVKRMVIVHSDGKTVTSDIKGTAGEVKVIQMHRREGDGPIAMAFAGEAIACKDGGETSNVAATTDKDGKKQIVRVRICGKGDPAMATAHALNGLKAARERISGNGDMSSEIKSKVLEELDREIARLSKGG